MFLSYLINMFVPLHSAAAAAAVAGAAVVVTDSFSYPD